LVTVVGVVGCVLRSNVLRLNDDEVRHARLISISWFTRTLLCVAHYWPNLMVISHSIRLSHCL